MQNNFDADAVDDVICENVRVLHADCISCPCCGESCCGKDVESTPTTCSFNFELDTTKSYSVWPLCRRYKKVYAWAKDACSGERPSGGRPIG